MFEHRELLVCPNGRLAVSAVGGRFRPLRCRLLLAAIFVCWVDHAQKFSSAEYPTHALCASTIPGKTNRTTGFHECADRRAAFRERGACKGGLPAALW